MNNPHDLPWSAYPYDDGYIRDTKGNIVIHLSDMEKRDFIVEAVNNHDRLVRLARDLITCAEWSHKSMAMGRDLFLDLTRTAKYILEDIEGAE